MSKKSFSIASEDIKREKAATFSHLYTDNVQVTCVGDQIQILLGVHTPILDGDDVMDVKAIDYHALILGATLAKKLGEKLSEIAGPLVAEERKDSEIQYRRGYTHGAQGATTAADQGADRVSIAKWLQGPLFAWRSRPPSGEFEPPPDIDLPSQPKSD